MTTCDPCSEIVVNTRVLPGGGLAGGHAALRKSHMSGTSYHSRGVVNTEHFVCETCGAKWAYEDDNSDAFVGWSQE